MEHSRPSIPRRTFLGRSFGMSGWLILTVAFQRSRKRAAIDPDGAQTGTDPWKSAVNIAKKYGGEFGGISISRFINP